MDGWMDSIIEAVEKKLEQVILGIYTITAEGSDATTPPANVGIVIEGVEVLHDLGDIPSACAPLMGVIYALNLSYPQELKVFFEVLKKLFLQLDGSRQGVFYTDNEFKQVPLIQDYWWLEIFLRYKLTKLTKRCILHKSKQEEHRPGQDKQVQQQVNRAMDMAGSKPESLR
ncbi:hypothetical protein L3Q82_005860 [Scortum barcoo]|uniref:Uncharacterized protein n=1 Tax=Scortum barcoo TaxID=214431 RepID=A0ACB8V775_9TELE|nr:hypothetical protein L3Q82_005860 [Scortum barcoo]